VGKGSSCEIIAPLMAFVSQPKKILINGLRTRVGLHCVTNEFSEILPLVPTHRGIVYVFREFFGRTSLCHPINYVQSLNWTFVSAPIFIDQCLGYQWLSWFGHGFETITVKTR